MCNFSSFDFLCLELYDVAMKCNISINHYLTMKHLYLYLCEHKYDETENRKICLFGNSEHRVSPHHLNSY
jgi:hypothetical protein